MDEFILAGDIGGTKTSLSLYDKNKGPGTPLEKKTFASRDFDSLKSIVETYLSQKSVQICMAIFGVAGPVKDGCVETTNLPWTLTEASLRSAVDDAPVTLINDLTAAAHAIPYLEKTDLRSINQGKPEPQGPLGLVSPGTGLGEAFLTWNGQEYQAHPSEGGHCSFAPTNQNQLELLDFLLPKYGHVSYERVCSGNGITNLYAYMKEIRQIPEPDWLKTQLADADDPNPVLFRAALQDNVKIAVKTLKLFIEILANEASNLTLKVMATGGIYIGGGIPPRLMDLIDLERFMMAFTNKGRFDDWLETVPIHVIVKPETALFGAACFGFEQLHLSPGN